MLDQRGGPLDAVDQHDHRGCVFEQLLDGALAAVRSQPLDVTLFGLADDLDAVGMDVVERARDDAGATVDAIRDDGLLGTGSAGDPGQLQALRQCLEKVADLDSMRHGSWSGRSGWPVLPRGRRRAGGRATRFR